MVAPALVILTVQVAAFSLTLHTVTTVNDFEKSVAFVKYFHFMVIFLLRIFIMSAEEHMRLYF